MKVSEVQNPLKFQPYNFVFQILASSFATANLAAFNQKRKEAYAKLKEDQVEWGRHLQQLASQKDEMDEETARVSKLAALKKKMNNLVSNSEQILVIHL